MSAMSQGAPPPPEQTAEMGMPSAERAVPTIVIHGDRDTTVHAMNGERLIADWIARHRGDYRQTTERLEDAGGRPYTRTCYRDADGRVLLEYWVLHGFGHAWSGGSASGSFTDPNGPDASREVLRFFLSEPPPKRRSGNYRERLREKLGELRALRP
jgi:poly(3-hydroxybutyrate) depolymerase